MGKLATLHDAVATLIRDGDCVYAAGFTHLIPFAAGHEIIRQRRKDLVLARATPDLVYDQMIAGGCARKIIFSYAGNPGVGLLKAMRAEIEAGRLDWEEYSHFSMITRLTAGAAGLPFLPMNPTGAEDLLQVNPNFRRLTDPYSGRQVITVPALNPDVAIVHVQRADADGNCQLWGIVGEQREVAREDLDVPTFRRITHRIADQIAESAAQVTLVAEQLAVRGEIEGQVMAPVAEGQCLLVQNLQQGTHVHGFL